MQFNTWLFLFMFLPITVAGYFALNRYVSKKRQLIGLFWQILYFMGMQELTTLSILLLILL